MTRALCPHQSWPIAPLLIRVKNPPWDPLPSRATPTWLPWDTARRDKGVERERILAAAHQQPAGGVTVETPLGATHTHTVRRVAK